jgi:hypothetical protein
MKKLIVLFMLLAVPAMAQMETGVVTRIKILSPQGKELTVELQGWTIAYDLNTFEGEVVGLTVGTNGIVTAGRIVANEADIEAKDPYRGLILHATNDTAYVISVDTNGALFTTLISTSPEIPYSNRVAKIKDHLGRRGDNRRKRLKYDAADVNVNTGGSWDPIHADLSKNVKVGKGDKLLVMATIYGKANATKTVRTSLFLNGNNKGTGSHGLAFTDSENVSNVGFVWMSKKLNKGTVNLELRMRGKGTIVSSKVPASMTYILVEKDW